MTGPHNPNPNGFPPPDPQYPPPADRPSAPDAPQPDWSSVTEVTGFPISEVVAALPRRVPYPPHQHTDQGTDGTAMHPPAAQHHRPDWAPPSPVGSGPAYPPPPRSPAAPPTAGERAPHGIDETTWSTEAAEKTGPKLGWRGGIAKVGIKLPKSRAEMDYDRDILRIQRKLAYPQNIAVVALKGGSGKSTTTIALGSTLSAARHVSDIVAVDSATDGSLRRRMPKDQNRSISSDAKRFLRSLDAAGELSGSEIQVQLYSNSTGLQVLVSADNLREYTLDGGEYIDIISALHKHYMINIIDTSPDRRVPTFDPIIRSAHALVLVAAPNADSIEKAARFVEWLHDSGQQHLLTRTVMVWNHASPGKETVIKPKQVKSQFVRQLSPDADPSTCLVDIPFDPHLAACGEINLTLLHKDTRRQFERVAALVMDKLPDLSAQRQNGSRP